MPSYSEQQTTNFVILSRSTTLLDLLMLSAHTPKPSLLTQLDHQISHTNELSEYMKQEMRMSLTAIQSGNVWHGISSTDTWIRDR